MANILKDIQDCINAFLSGLPENIKKQKIKTLPFCKDFNNYILSATENYKLHIKKDSQNFYCCLVIKTPKNQEINMSLLQSLKSSKKTTIKNIIEKIQKITNFYLKNQDKNNKNFSKIFIDSLIKDQNFTPENQKIITESQYFKVLKNEKDFIIVPYKEKKIKEIALKNYNKNLFQRFFRNQYTKIKGKLYTIQNYQSSENHWYFSIKNKENIPIENFHIQNTIKDFHTLSHLIKNTQKILPTLKFPRS